MGRIVRVRDSCIPPIEGFIVGGHGGINSNLAVKSLGEESCVYNRCHDL